MRFIDEFRDGQLARGLAAAIRQAAHADRDYSFMEFCGGHTHAIARYGVSDPAAACGASDPRPRLSGLRAADRAHRHGDSPCPRRRRHPVQLRRPDARAGFRWPVADQGQSEAGQGQGNDDNGRVCARVRRDSHDLFAGRRAGAGAATPRAAGGLPGHRFRDHDAADGTAHQTGTGVRPEQFLGSLLPRADAVGDGQHSRIAGSPPLGNAAARRLIGPAHVSTIIGTRPYEFFAEEYRKPVVIAGFEPLDVMQAILMLIKQVNAGTGAGRERVLARRQPRRQPQGAAAGRRRFRAASLVCLARTR